jgi:hypothetical protein
MDQHEPVINTSDITPKWVESCLRSHFNLPSGAVENVRVTESFGSCSALNTRIEVEYSTDAVGNAPRHLMLRNSGGRDRLNEREVRFYSELAPLLPQTPTVPCYDVAWDLSPPRWHVLLLDVSPSHDHGPQPLTTTQRQFLMPAHARDTSPPEPYPDETYAAIAEAYASLHARWWDNSVIHEERHAKSPGGPHCIAAAPSPDEIMSIAKHRLEYDFPRYRTQFPDDPSPAEWRMCEKAVETWPQLLTPRAAAGNLTLVQSDSHLGNILLDRDPASSHIYLLDWDAYQRGIGPWDLACLLILSHAPEIRRRVELKVLGIYHQALLAHGVANYSFDQCVADYRLAAFVCPFVPIVWGRPEFVTYALTAFADWDCADMVR